MKLSASPSFEPMTLGIIVVDTSVRASASVSRFVSSFLLGRRRLRMPPGLSLDVRALETSIECFMRRLSFFVVLNVEVVLGKLVEGLEREDGLMGA